MKNKIVVFSIYFLFLLKTTDQNMLSLSSFCDHGKQTNNQKAGVT